MSSPISESLLVHTATLNPKASEDDYGNPVAGTPVTLTKVRVSRISYSPVTAMGESVNDRLTLIFDCINSLPAGTIFKEGDTVTYNSVTYKVREVGTPSGDESSIHHYRVVLAGA